MSGSIVHLLAFFFDSFSRMSSDTGRCVRVFLHSISEESDFLGGQSIHGRDSDCR